VKHLNPRQGITTNETFAVLQTPDVRRVKHLNPRQGITTRHDLGVVGILLDPCETPKSPPGDYNLLCSAPVFYFVCLRVKHLNPRQGITTLSFFFLVPA